MLGTECLDGFSILILHECSVYAGIAQYSSICSCYGTVEYVYSDHLRSLHCQHCGAVCVEIADSYCIRLVCLIPQMSLLDKGHIGQAGVLIAIQNFTLFANG